MKNAYFFTLCFFLYRFSFLVISLLLPWVEGKNFFEILIERNIAALYIVEGIIFFFLFIITQTIVSFIKEKKLLFKNQPYLRTFFSIHIVWLLFSFETIFASITFALSNIFLIGATDGVGATILNYVWLGPIDLFAVPDFLWVLSFITLYFVIPFFPFLIFGSGLPQVKTARRYKKDLPPKQRDTLQAKKHKKDWQRIAWICCMVASSGFFLGLFLSLFFPWSTFDNFIALLLLGLNIQTGGFLITVVFSVILLFFIVIWIFSQAFPKKLRNQSGIAPVSIDKRGLEEDPLKIRLSRWFIYWMILWMSLSTSIVLGLLLVGVESISATPGFSFYFSMAHSTVIFSIILGFGVVLHHVNQISKKKSFLQNSNI